MQKLQRQLLICLVVYACSLVNLAGCATPTHQDVGVVVVAPRVQLTPPPQVVQQTPPKPAGYFQCLLLSYFKEPCERPTTLTWPTPVAEQTPTP